jgi:hypothetical protein
VKELIRRLVIAFMVMFLGFSIPFLIVVKEYRALEVKNIELEKQLQTALQEKDIFKEGKYTMITNLSSSMYVNRIPKNFEGALPWTDVNGVSGFDIEVGSTHYRYVEGHIEMPQLALYAPNIHLEVVSEKEVGQ